MSLDVREALAPVEQQFLIELKNTGWTDEQLRELGRAWGIANKDIEAVAGAPCVDELDREVRIAIIAAQVSHAINVGMRVSTPAILKANAEDLLEWIDFYHQEADRLYRAAVDAQLSHPDGRAHGNPAFDEAFTQFHRICGFLWEANEQAGVNQLMHVVGAAA